MNCSNSFIGPEETHRPTQVPSPQFLSDSKSSKSAKQACLLSLSKLKLKIPKIRIKPFKRRSHGSNSFTIARNIETLDDQRKLPASMPSIQSFTPDDKNLEIGSVSDNNDWFSIAMTEDSHVGCARQKIDGRDWSDLCSFRSTSFKSDRGLDVGKQPVTPNAAINNCDMEKVECGIENLDSLMCGEGGEYNFMEITLPESQFNLITNCSSTESSTNTSSIGCGSSFGSSFSDGQSEKPVSCTPSRVPKKLQRMKLKFMSRISCLPMRQLKEMIGMCDTKAEKNELWKKRILMGKRCQPLDFSGVIHYNEKGNQIVELPYRDEKMTPREGQTSSC